MVSASAQVWLRGEGEKLEAEALDFVSQRITAKCKVPVRRTAGRAVDLDFAIRSVQEAARTHDQALREAVGADH
ncbi:hypothetical protein [Kitasatospora sp. NPDC088346]|uniref:hypothetical protein n=1 Tax=Kitasatospora sp. NPDC088346 TaxID=3364073 RepID=UPI0038180DC5